MKITIAKVIKLTEIEEKYNIGKYFNEALGKSAMEKHVSAQYIMANLPKKEKLKVIEFYVEYYCEAMGVDRKKVEVLDFEEVKTQVNNFRIKYS